MFLKPCSKSLKAHLIICACASNHPPRAKRRYSGDLLTTDLSSRGLGLRQFHVVSALSQGPEALCCYSGDRGLLSA